MHTQTTEADTERKINNVRHEPDPTINEKEYSVENAIFKIIAEEPFLGTVLTHCVLQPDWKCDTAYASIHPSGRIRIGWNPDFMRQQTIRQKMGVFKHELLHIVLLHLTKRKIVQKIRMMLANIAMDFAINSLICSPLIEKTNKTSIIDHKILLPEICAMPKVITKELEEKTPEFAKWLKEAPYLESSEYYYQHMLNSIPEKEISALESLNLVDNHGGWEFPKELENIVNGYLHKSFSEGKNKARAANGWGTVSLEIQELISEFLGHTVNWQEAIRSFYGSAVKTSYETSYRKLSKKLPGFMPGVRHETVANIVCFIDQSGSVSNDEVSRFLAELAGCAKIVPVVCYNFDTKIDFNSRQKISSRQKIEWKRTLGGGTNFACIADWIENRETQEKCDAIIILTDGFAEPMRPIRKKLLWILTANGTEKNIEKGENVSIAKIKQD